SLVPAQHLYADVADPWAAAGNGDLGIWPRGGADPRRFPAAAVPAHPLSLYARISDLADRSAVHARLVHGFSERSERRGDHRSIYAGPGLPGRAGPGSGRDAPPRLPARGDGL